MPSCSPADSAFLRRARPLLGTFVEIRLAAPDTATAERALRAGFAAVARVQRLMSYHEAASDVARLNRLSARRPVAVHPWTAAVLRRAVQLHRVSDGLFDITVAPALARGGWLPANRARGADPGATAADIEFLPGSRVRFRRPLLIDLGGIAKGYAVDRAVSALRRHGALSGIVNAGGDLRVFGPAWETVHVRAPDAPGEFTPLVQLRDSALATSAHYFAARRQGGRLCAPVIDPRTAAPSSAARSVTVQAPECWLADALCKVVWLAGAAAAPWLEKSGARAWVFDARPRIRDSRRHAA